jgi:hypothetical protein
MVGTFLPRRKPERLASSVLTLCCYLRRRVGRFTLLGARFSSMHFGQTQAKASSSVRIWPHLAQMYLPSTWRTIILKLPSSTQNGHRTGSAEAIAERGEDLGGFELLQRFGVIFAAKECATIFPFRTTNVSVPASYMLSGVSAFQRM